MPRQHARQIKRYLNDRMPTTTRRCETPRDDSGAVNVARDVTHRPRGTLREHHPARASTTSYSSPGLSFFLRGFRARDVPRLPVLPASSLNGKEGVDGSSPSEGFAEMPVHGPVSLFGSYTSGTREHSLVFPCWAHRHA
jgi:hypothetical protein